MNNSKKHRKIMRKIAEAKNNQYEYRILEPPILLGLAPLSKPLPTPLFDATARKLSLTEKASPKPATFIAINRLDKVTEYFAISRCVPASRRQTDVFRSFVTCTPASTSLLQQFLSMLRERRFYRSRNLYHIILSLSSHRLEWLTHIFFGRLNIYVNATSRSSKVRIFHLDTDELLFPGHQAGIQCLFSLF